MISKGKSMLTPEKDNRIRIVNERINFVEKHFGELCSAFGAYTRKLGRYRDKHDDLAKAFQAYSEEEPYSKTTATALDSLTKGMTFMADYMDLEVQRLDAKVISQLTPYENVCRLTRESLKSAILTRDKEVAREKQLMEIRSKFIANSSAADSELLKAKVKVNRTNKDVDSVVENFEKRVLKDIKTILLDFIAIEMKQHTKALEILTATYQDVADIDENRDYQSFKHALRVKQNKHRSHSLDNLGIPKSLSLKTNRLSRSTRNLAAGEQEKTSEDSTSASDDADSNNDEDKSLPPDQDSDSESSDESSVRKDSAKNAPKLKASQVPTSFNAFCEGVKTSNCKEPIVLQPSRTPRTIQVRSVNGVTKRI